MKNKFEVNHKKVFDTLIILVILTYYAKESTRKTDEYLSKIVVDDDRLIINFNKKDENLRIFKILSNNTLLFHHP